MYVPGDCNILLISVCDVKEKNIMLKKKKLLSLHGKS